MPEYTLYVDVWLLRLSANFAFEYLLLWATAAVTRTPTSSKRLAAASLVGTLHYLLYLLASLQIIPFYGLLRFIPVVVIVSILMILITFYPLAKQRILSILGHFYVIGFVAAGAGIGGAYLLGDFTAPRFPFGILISIVTILIIAELGWGVIHQRIIHSVYQLPLEITCGEKSVMIRALIDTGNNLRDPLSRQPVIIVEHEAVASLIPQTIVKAVRSLENGDLTSIDRIVEEQEWAARLRIIPFSSIGKENGLLIGFRPDRVRFVNGASGDLDVQPIIALHPRILDPEGEYEALVPPTVLQEAVALPKNVDQEQITVSEGGQSHAASSNPKV